MLLTIDIGNTTIALGGLERQPDGDYRVRFNARMNTVRRRRESAYLAEMKGLLKSRGLAPGDLTGAVLSTVVPSLRPTLGACAKALTGAEPVYVSAASRTGLRFAIPEPQRLGQDRIVDAAWAAARFPLPAVTVDMGTATTFNVIDEGGVFLGGIIAPGLATGINALTQRTAQLPQVRLHTPTQVIGQNTNECMVVGAVAGAAAMVDGLTARIEAQLGKPVFLVLTGGLARHVHPLCSHPHCYDPDLLAKGLALLYEKNCKKG